jgi:hypothetical protein
MINRDMALPVRFAMQRNLHGATPIVKGSREACIVPTEGLENGAVAEP